ncbi:MAG: hypothetical protein GX790_01420 [Syntrophomonadaceae bacterium]|nr:hypothetical protein [Syntrophomonadaceae bacterium]
MVRKYFSGLLILLLLFGVMGCNIDLPSIPYEKDVASNLIKVEITFTDDKTLVGYVKELGIEQQGGKVYVGGSSLNYLYDKDGNVIGAFNYQRVLFMKIITEEETIE